MSRPTISDVAVAAQVSTATVSRHLNGVSTVAPELRERVEAAIRDLGYVRNPVGRALRRQRVDIVSLVVPDTKNAFYNGLAYGLESVLVDRGIQLVVGNTDETVSREQQYIAAAVSQRFSGAVLAVASQASTAYRMLEDEGIPLVLVDRRVEGYQGPSVVADNARVGELAAEYLWKQGFRRPAVMASSNDISTTGDRAKGFQQAAHRLGMELPPELVVAADPRESGAESALWWLLGSGRSFDAVFAANGPLTAATFRVLQAAGRMDTPGCGLVGVDDELWTDMVRPSVTVFRQPVEEMGRIAATMLLARLEGREIAEPHVTLLPQMVERESALGKLRRG